MVYVLKTKASEEIYELACMKALRKVSKWFYCCFKYDKVEYAKIVNAEMRILYWKSCFGDYPSIFAKTAALL